MSINIGPPSVEELRPRITVIGVGGAGGNAIANMIGAQIEGVEFVVANTDAQALNNAVAEQRIQLGSDITQGLGAGAPAHSRGDEAHVRAVEHALDLGQALLGSGASDFGSRTRTKTLRDIRAELDPLFGNRVVERLRIGVGDDEIDTFNLCTNHIGNSVSACSTNADNGDFRLQFVNHWWTDIDAHDFIPLASLAC